MPGALCKHSFAPNKRRCVEGANFHTAANRHSICNSQRPTEASRKAVHRQSCCAAATHSDLKNSATLSGRPQLPACLQPFVTDASKWWNWNYDSKVHYRKQGSSGPPVLLVHGFGVGAFHFEQLLDQLSSSHQVWAIDLLGQGMSWPSTRPSQGETSFEAAVFMHAIIFAISLAFEQHVRCCAEMRI